MIHTGFKKVLTWVGAGMWQGGHTMALMYWGCSVS